MEQPITKKSILDYVNRIRQMEISKPEIVKIRERICDKLDVLMIPLAKAMERVENNQAKIKEHWEEYGDNYNSIPTLHSIIPNYVESFGDIVALTFEEKSILVNGIINLFETADKQIMEVSPVEEKEIEPEVEEVEPEPEEKPKKKRGRKKKNEALSSED